MGCFIPSPLLPPPPTHRACVYCGTITPLFQSCRSCGAPFRVGIPPPRPLPITPRYVDTTRFIA